MPTFAEKIEGLFTREAVTQREVPEYSTGAMLKDALKTWAGWRKKQWPFRDMTEREMMEQAAGFTSILKPMAMAKLLKTGYDPFRWGLTRAQQRHLVNLLKVPGEEFKGLRNIAWEKMGPASGQFKVSGKSIVVNPSRFMEDALRHEFVHKRQWLPRAGDPGELRGSNLLRLLRSGGIQRDTWKYLEDPVELHAKLATALMKKGFTFNQAFQRAMARPEVYKPAAKAMGDTLATELFKIAKQASKEGVKVDAMATVQRLLAPRP